MPNLSDNDIDKLFKQAADQQQPQFDPADWDDLQKRLDQPERSASYFNWTSTIVLLGALVWLSWTTVNSFESERIAGVIKSSSEEKSTSMNTDSRLSLKSDTITSGHDDDNDNDNVLNHEAQSNGAIVSYENELNSTEKNGATSIREPEQGATSTKKLINESTSKDIESKNRKKVAKQEGTNAILVKEVVAAQAENNQSVVVGEEVARNSVADKNRNLIPSNDFKAEQPNELSTNKSLLTVSTTNNTNSKGSELKGNVDSFNTEQSRKTSSAANAKTLALTDTPKDSMALLNKDEDEVKVAKSNKPSDSLIKKGWLQHLAIKATISPDFSADQFKSVEKTGLNYGMMLEYFIHEKFSVSAGAIWSRKYYSAQDVAYGYYQADKVYGDCRMWDIPLNITYYSSPAQQYSFFFSAGASSYLMNEENYTYQIETGYGTVSYDKQVLKENNEWFKMLNLSVGVQKKFRKRWAFQLEPFIKVPLAGVGEGNIQLSSFGSFFSIRYKILDP